MIKESLAPENSAEIMGSYSHGLNVDLGNNKEMIFVTGQIAQDANGNVVCEDIEGQTEYVFHCLQDIPWSIPPRPLRSELTMSGPALSSPAP